MKELLSLDVNELLILRNNITNSTSEISQENLDLLKKIDNILFYKSQSNIITPPLSNDLFIAKSYYLSEINNKYHKSLNIRIKNSFSFDINLRDKNGEILLNIIENARGSYSNHKKASYIQKFFVNIIENNQVLQINASCYNWIWEYLFNSLLEYAKIQKQTKEDMINFINNFNDVNQLKSISQEDNRINFYSPNGLIINVSECIENLIKNLDLNSQNLNIPRYVIEAIHNQDRKIFKYTDTNAEKEKLKNLVENSLFNLN